MNEPDSSWPDAVIGDVLHQGLADALHDAAMELALDQQRVDHVADIVHRGVADQRTSPVSGSISTSLMWQPFGIGAFAAREGAGLEQAGFDAARQLCRHKGGAGDVGEVDRLVGAGDHEAAVARIQCRARRLPSCGRRCDGPWR